MTLTAKDFATDQDVRWCPGCGDYSILKAVQKTLAEVGAKPATTAFISGIGCAARFPYYINSYGFHTIHGRAAAVATGTKLAQPDLDVWVVGGDGDSLAIGGNHLMHLLRRNVNLQFLLINNSIYGLTKGQASPTSQTGLKTPSSPDGTIDSAVNACAFALGSGGKFVARSGDTMQDHLHEVLVRSHAFCGTGFVEILQNCPVYHDGAFDGQERLLLQHGKPMIFGDKALRFNQDKMRLEVVAKTAPDILVHDETNEFIAGMLARLESPVAMGVLYACKKTKAFEVEFNKLGSNKKRNKAELKKLLHSGISWKI